MKRSYETPEMEVIQLGLTDVILTSVPTPTDNEMPILGRRQMEEDLYGDLPSATEDI